MTRFLEDILRQPLELQRTIDFLRGAGRSSLVDAVAALRRSRRVYLTGIGSSWHAALTAGPIFSTGSFPVYMQDAAELLQFASIPAESVVVVISRTGRSVEIVQVLAKARDCGAIVIGITNSKDGPLAREAHIPIVVAAKLDHGISVNTYSTLAATASALASAAVGVFDDVLTTSLSRALSETTSSIAIWQERLAMSTWLSPGSVYYFLARGSSLGTSHEARLLWEEGAKAPATAMGTGGFRHGPQEMVAQGTRVGMWVDARTMRAQDLAVARDLSHIGSCVMLVGQNLPEVAGDLVFRLPAVPAEWQFLIDVIPAQLAAERLARLSGVDCDSFRFCSYIVEDEWGILRENVGMPQKEV